MNPTTVSRLKDILSGSQFDSVMRIMQNDLQTGLYTREEVKTICLAFDRWQCTPGAGVEPVGASFDLFWESDRPGYGDRGNIGGKRFQKAVPGTEPDQPTRYFKGCTFVATFKDETGNMHTFIELQANGFDKAEAFPLFIRDKEIEFSHNYGTNGALIFTTVIPPGL